FVSLYSRFEINLFSILRQGSIVTSVTMISKVSLSLRDEQKLASMQEFQFSAYAPLVEGRRIIGQNSPKQKSALRAVWRLNSRRSAAHIRKLRSAPCRRLRPFVSIASAG